MHIVRHFMANGPQNIAQNDEHLYEYDVSQESAGISLRDMRESLLREALETSCTHFLTDCLRHSISMFSMLASSNWNSK